jgi:hypothetical protein
MRERKLDRLIFCEEKGAKPKDARDCRPPSCRCLTSDITAEPSGVRGIGGDMHEPQIRFFDDDIPGVEVIVRGLKNGEEAIENLLSLLNKFGHDSFTSKINELISGYDECIESIKE